MSYLLTSNEGDVVAQHHGPVTGGLAFPMTKRMTQRKIRTYGLDFNGNLLLCDGVTVPQEPNSIGDGFASEAVWYASGVVDPNGMVREVPYWAGALPGVIQLGANSGKTGERTKDEYHSNVVGPLALPAFWQKPGGGGWEADTGVLPQKVAIVGGSDVPGGTPVIVLPFSIRTEQQMAAVAVGNQLIAVWQGGPANGKYGSIVHDVDERGNLDPKRRARLQSSFRVYRLPGIGKLPFGGDPSTVPTGKTASGQSASAGEGDSTKGHYERTSSSYQGYDGVTHEYNVSQRWVPAQAGSPPASGEGGVLDAVALGSLGVLGPLLLKSGSGLAGAGAGAGGGGGGPAPAGSLLPGGLAWQHGLDIDSQAGYGMIVDMVAPVIPPPPDKPDPPRNVTNTPSGNTPSNTAAIGALSGTATTPAGTSPAISVVGTTISIGVATPPPPPPSGSTPTKSKDPVKYGPAVPVFGACAKVAYGLHSVGDVKDIHYIATTPDGDNINPTHLHVRAPWEGDGFDAPPETIQAPYVPPQGSGPLWCAVEFRNDPKATHPFIDGPRPGLRKWEVLVPFDTKTTHVVDDGKDPDKPISKDQTTTGAKDQATVAGKDISVVIAKDQVTITGKDQSSYEGTDKSQQSDTVFPAKRGSAKDQGLVDAQDSGTSTQVVPNASTATAQGSYTFGGGILFGGGDPVVQNAVDLDGPKTVSFNRGYARSPLELRVPALVAYGIPLFAPDLRGRTDELTPEQLAVYEQDVPVSGVISGIADQSTGAYVFNSYAKPGSSVYADGASAGGFMLTPGNVDPKTVQLGLSLPNSMPRTSFFFATTASQLAMADATKAGTPRDGYVTRRTSTTAMQTDFYNGSGTVFGTIPDYWDESTTPPTRKIWGGIPVTTYNNVSGIAAADTVFVADGTNAGAAGAWVAKSTLAGTDCTLYGDASDGNATCDAGGTAVTGMTFAAGAYTMNRDVFYDTLTVNATVLVYTGGFVLHARTQLVNNGLMGNPGNNGQNAVAGGAGGAAAATGTLAASGAGGAGQVGAGLAGTNVAQAYGGAGGAGGAGLGGAGGAAGTKTAPTAAEGSIRKRPNSTIGVLFGSAVNQAKPGAGGGGGAGDTGANTGGGGGSGGGNVYIVARLITGNGAFASPGGQGGSAAAFANCGGGGGGGGGSVVFTCPNMTGFSGTSTAAAGNGGAAGAGGVAGAAGAAGSVIQNSACP